VSRRVLVDSYFAPDEVRALLDGTGAVVEPLEGGPLAGDDVIALVVWERHVGEAELERLPRLEIVVTPSVGYDHIELEPARRRGVWVCNVPAYCVEEMADSALALLLALLRGIVELDRDVRAGRWNERAAGPLRRVADTRLGVVGFGRIGRALAARAAAVGMEVWATDPPITPEAIAAAGARPATLEELLPACGAFSLHLPLTADTRGLIGARELASMPRGAVLVNTARGGLVDTGALIAALRSGHIAGAALDVLEVEPPTPAHPAPRARGLIVTPHAAWYSEEAERELKRRAIGAVRAVLEGREPDGVVVRP
jgi:D-3-phosphoglycerate dehydrogenase